MPNEVYKGLPNEYDNSISYYEVLTKVVDKLNQLIDKIESIKGTDIQYMEETERMIIYDKEIV